MNIPTSNEIEELTRRLADALNASVKADEAYQQAFEKKQKAHKELSLVMDEVRNIKYQLTAK